MKRALRLAIALVVAFAGRGSARANVNVCWELLEPIWVPPTAMDPQECFQSNWPLSIAGLVQA